MDTRQSVSRVCSAVDTFHTLIIFAVRRSARERNRGWLARGVGSARSTGSSRDTDKFWKLGNSSRVALEKEHLKARLPNRRQGHHIAKTEKRSNKSPPEEIRVEGLPIVRPQPGQKVVPIRTQARSATILPNFVGLKFQVYNGKAYIDVTITEDMVGHKLGEFSPTRKPFIWTRL
ncbi:Putative small ribosomal subunit protein uS19 [Colletotrichum destructivum]|uniref:Small ribosomal subunit protein uS19 n=1 Tax=Colletotrichum destructivum TaxID=34406 RepID=A0AAX4IGX4_9PEZI|nr:Putative small ribosomal subunit protein uS19 [Colletotrichum destructivum]